MADGFLELTSESLKTSQGISVLNEMLKKLFDVVAGDGEKVRVFTGFATPENVIVAKIGSLYLRQDGGAATSLYVKESGTGATGWIAK